MFGKPGTKAEIAALAAAAGVFRVTAPDQADLLDSLRAKLTAPYKPKPELPDVGAIEDALGCLRTPADTPQWHNALARKAAAVGANVEDARVIGPWLKAQRWGQSMTVDRVLAGWPSYLARARAAQGSHDDLDGEFGARRDFVPDE